MNECHREREVQAAASGGVWSDELRDHCAACSPCAETAVVAAALCADAQALEIEDGPLPDPRYLWLRARLETRRRQSARATRAIAWVQRAAVLCALVVAGVAAPGLWRLLGRATRELEPAVASIDLPLAVAAPGLVLAVTVTVLVLLALWNELVEGGRDEV
jgi:hypothetical protein